MSLWPLGCDFVTSILMRSFVKRRFLFASLLLWKQICGDKSNRFQEGGCHESKLQSELKISVDTHPQSIKSTSTKAAKILTASHSNKLINIHDRANSTLFPGFSKVAGCRRTSPATPLYFASYFFVN